MFQAAPPTTTVNKIKKN